MKESIARCAYSGTVFKIQHFNLKLLHSEIVHPIFCVEQKKLLQYVFAYNELQLSQEEEWLLFLALLKSTSLIEWRVTAEYTEDAPVVVAECISKLAEVAVKIASISNAAIVFPKLVICADNCRMQNVSVYIDSLIDEYAGLQESYKRSEENKKAAVRETSLQKLIKNSSFINEAEYVRKAGDLKKYSRQIAEWAATVGYFPDHEIKVGRTKQKCSDYWKHIIVCCTSEEKIFSIDKGDLERLIDFCELEIPAGSIYHFHLMKLLKSGLQKHSNYLGLGDVDLSDTPGQVTWRELDGEASVEDASKLAIIMSAPKEAPKESNYPSKFSYMQAKLKYEMAQEHALKQAEYEAALVGVEEVVTDEIVELADSNSDLEEVDTDINTLEDTYTDSNTLEGE